MTEKQFKYLVKLVVICSLMGASLSFLGSTIANERLLARMDKSYQRLMEWSKKADLANEMLNDMFKVQGQKEAYEAEGIGAEEYFIKKDNKNQDKQEVCQ